MSDHLPFSSVVGQDDAKLALLLAAVEPRLGGVLLRGDKGSAKTTLARGLAALLPGDAPFVELPLGASEDRVVGSLDVAALLGDRVHAFRPGLLAAAHGGVLYVDEVNLLPDHLVDVLLDVAVSGTNRVERDGFSEAHPARFVLVGSMNPEEGELRPQLLDRFGLAVDVKAPDDPILRAEIVRRQLAFDAAAKLDPSPDDAVRRSLASAHPVPCDDAVVVAAAELAVAVGAQGLRADLALCRAAGALAGLEGASTAGLDQLRGVAPLVLGHRRRRDPFEAPGLAEDELATALDRVLGDAGARSDEQVPGDDGAADGGRRRDVGPASAPQSRPTTEPDGAPHGGPGQAEGPGGADSPGVGDPGVGDPGVGDPGVGDPGVPTNGHGQAPDPKGPSGAAVLLDERRLSIPRVGSARGAGGARSGPTAATGAERGRRIGHVPFEPPLRRVDGASTAVAYAVRTADAGREADEGDRVAVEAEDLRAAVTAGPRARLVVLAVDASGSIAGRRRLDAAHAAIVSLLGDAYRRRDRVAMVVFRGESAEVVLRPTGSVEVARARLAQLESGGRTPLAAGLRAVASLVTAAQRQGGADPSVVLVTDGRATSGGDDPLAAAASAAVELATTGVPCLVVDAETGPARLGLARSLAAVLSADYVLLEDIEQPGGPPGLADAIRARVLATPATPATPGRER
jgi:magnesium chelatase subunit D